MNFLTIRNKVLVVILIVLLSSGILTTLIWYSNSSKMADKYLKDISESTMRDAYKAFNYLLTDTSYMATMISLNDKNIIQPIKKLNKKDIMVKGQWNQEYLDNKRVIYEFISGMNGYKYYIVGITIVANKDCIFSTSHIMQNHDEIYKELSKLDQENLKNSMVMMNPIHVEGGKSTLSSDYVVPAVRGILDRNRKIIGYTVLYFDYAVIEKMFASNLPKGNLFQVINSNASLIFSNCGDTLLNADKPKKGFVYNTFDAKSVGWNFIMAIPSEYYIADIHHTAILIGCLMAVIFLLAGLISTVIITKMTSEITTLRNSMRKVTLGDLNISYLVKSDDEIGQMGRTFNHMITHIRELINQVAEEEKQKRLNEIAFLQAQINPHFVSNVLNNVVWIAKIQHADNIVPLINSLNTLLQNAMHQEKDLIILQDELDYVDNYLKIIEYNGSYDFYVEKNIAEDTKNLYLLRFILQPILENAIYHGLPNDLSRNGCIKIQSKRQNSLLYISIEDNGNGMTEEEIKKILNGEVQNRKSFNGIGIVNVNERIRLFFGEEYGLHYESQIGVYTKAVFKLPIIEKIDEEDIVCQKLD